MATYLQLFNLVTDYKEVSDRLAKLVDIRDRYVAATEKSISLVIRIDRTDEHSIRLTTAEATPLFNEEVFELQTRKDLLEAKINSIVLN